MELQAYEQRQYPHRGSQRDVLFGSGLSGAVFAGGTQWVKVMRNDPIVEEMRMRGREFSAKHGDDIRRICEALRELEVMFGRKVVHREPKGLERKAAG